MDKWQKLKGFLTDGKEHITKDFYVSRPSVFEEILDIMEELEKREVSEIEQIKAEIKDLHNSHMIHLIDTDGVVDTCLDIIDEHISELKGE